MIDSRRCASWTGAAGSRSSKPSESGPRCAIRPLMVRTRTAPSGCPKAPAMPHTSGRPGDLERRPTDEAVNDAHVRRTLERPAQPVLYAGPAHGTHLRPAGRVVEQVDDRLGVPRDVTVGDVG